MPYYACPCHTITYLSMPYHAMPYHTIPYHTIPYHVTFIYGIIPYHTMRYETVWSCMCSAFGGIECYHGQLGRAAANGTHTVFGVCMAWRAVFSQLLCPHVRAWHVALCAVHACTHHVSTRLAIASACLHVRSKKKRNQIHIPVHSVAVCV